MPAFEAFSFYFWVMNIILFDQENIWKQLQPLTLNRPVSHLRVGIFSMYQKWELTANASISFLTAPYLSKKFSVNFEKDSIYVSSQLLPTKPLLKAIESLKTGEVLLQNDRLLAVKSDNELSWPLLSPQGYKKVDFKESIIEINFPEDLFLNNGEQIKADFETLTIGRESESITDPFTRIYNKESLFVEKGANIKAAIINAEEGPVYIGENAIIQEGSVIIGPVSIGSSAKVGYNATIRQNTTIGPVCRVAGEVSNCIFMAYSNKSHDGFLGNSVVGEWCNFGANSNGSNLKNNYKNVAIHDYSLSGLRDVERINCGSIVGDFSKFGISTMLNTGTVVGVCTHVFGAGFQPKFIPSFSWGGPNDFVDYNFEKALEVIGATMSTKGLVLDENSSDILAHIFKNKEV